MRDHATVRHDVLHAMADHLLGARGPRTQGQCLGPAGRIYGTAGCWGSQLGRKGNLTIKQRKLGWLSFLPAPSQASFLVGRFRTVAVTSGEEDAEE